MGRLDQTFKEVCNFSPLQDLKYLVGPFLKLPWVMEHHTVQQTDEVMGVSEGVLGMRGPDPQTLQRYVLGWEGVLLCRMGVLLKMIWALYFENHQQVCLLPLFALVGHLNYNLLLLPNPLLLLLPFDTSGQYEISLWPLTCFP